MNFSDLFTNYTQTVQKDPLHITNQCVDWCQTQLEVLTQTVPNNIMTLITIGLLLTIIPRLLRPIQHNLFDTTKITEQTIDKIMNSITEFGILLITGAILWYTFFT